MKNFLFAFCTFIGVNAYAQQTTSQILWSAQKSLEKSLAAAERSVALAQHQVDRATLQTSLALYWQPNAAFHILRNTGDPLGAQLACNGNWNYRGWNSYSYNQPFYGYQNYQDFGYGGYNNAWGNSWNQSYGYGAWGGNYYSPHQNYYSPYGSGGFARFGLNFGFGF